MAEPAHIRHARELLERAQTTDDSPTDFVSTSDLREAERRLAAAYGEMREFSNSTDGYRQTIDREGRVGSVAEKWRFEKLDLLRQRIGQRQAALTSIKRAWLADIIKD